MNMSEEVVNVTLQITEKTVTTAVRTATAILEMIAKLLRDLTAMQREGARSQGGASDKLRGTDLTDLKPGRVEVKDLIASARKNGDTLSVSEQGLTKDDVKAITQKAKKYGIPIAFTNTDGKDNIYANVRTGDLPIFKQICTECIKDKIAERPQTLGNFQCAAWEIPFITAELKAHDLAAQFAATADGGHLCVYEKSDEKAIKIARNEFVKKCDELKQELTISKDDNGFYTISDQRSGKEITFDQIPDRDTLSNQMQSVFGYEQGKADLAAAKFGEEMLTGEQKAKFFSSSVQEQFSKITANIEIEGESILAKPYACWSVTPKNDAIPRLVFRNNETGEFAVLNPEKQTKKQMCAILTEQLGITDQKELDALTDKAEKVTAQLARENPELRTMERSFTNRSETDTTAFIGSEQVQTSKKPDSISAKIERTGQDSFAVTMAVKRSFTHEDGKTESVTTDQALTLKLTDKKNALKEMTDMLTATGISHHEAAEMAKEAFRKAEAQPAEKVVQLEEVKADQITVSANGETATIPTADKAAAVEAISEQCGVPTETAEVIVAKAEEITMPTLEQTAVATNNDPVLSEIDEETPEMDAVSPELRAEKPELSEIGGNGHEQHPEGNLLADSKPDSPTLPDVPSAAPSAPELPAAPDLPSAPQLPPPPAMGARH